MEKRTALQVVKRILTDLCAQAAFVVEYKPRTIRQLHDDYDYDTTKEPVQVPLENLESYTASKNHDEIELGICSKFINYNGDERHLMFVDVDGEKAPLSLLFAHNVLKTSRGWHVYTNSTAFNVAEVSAEIIREFEDAVDLKWLGAGLSQGYHILRLTANAPRFRDTGVPREL